MGKKRIITKTGDELSTADIKRAVARVAKKRISKGNIYIQSTYNNTKVLLTDEKGNTLAWNTSGALGFRGAKKGTPFAAAKVTEILCDKADAIGVKEVGVVVKGVGAGRESSIRTIASKGLEITSIKDVTPVPHNGPRPKKPRRV